MTRVLAFAAALLGAALAPLALVLAVTDPPPLGAFTMGLSAVCFLVSGALSHAFTIN
jgi:hypothetical protein